MVVSDTPWMELTRDDFLDAIKRLKPARMPKSYALKELQIGLVKEEAIFCIEGATTQRPASGVWNGFACVSYGMLLPFLKFKPEGDRVRLVFDQGRLKIGSTRFQARWIDASPWISQMALEVHFMGSSDLPKLFCPQCGKREGVALDSMLEKSVRTEQQEKLIEKLETINATHGCGSCFHGWKEILDVTRFNTRQR